LKLNFANKIIEGVRRYSNHTELGINQLALIFLSCSLIINSNFQESCCFTFKYESGNSNPR